MAETESTSAAPAVSQGAPAATTAGTQAPAKKPAEPPPSLGDFLTSPMFLLVIAVWAFFFWSMRKNKNKDEERKKELEALKKGDRVVTIGRVHGTVVSLNEDTMTLKVDEKTGATMKVDRAALFKVLPRDGGKDEKTAENGD